MPITPEDAQKLADLQRRMLANLAAGKPSHADFTQDEIREGLNFIRFGRASAVAAGQEKAAKTRKTAKKSSGQPLNLSSFTDMDLD